MAASSFRQVRMEAGADGRKELQRRVAGAVTTGCARDYKVKREAARLSPRERKVRVGSTCAGGMRVRIGSSLKVAAVEI